MLYKQVHKRLIKNRLKLGDLLQERTQKGDFGCASEKLGVPHVLSD